MAKLLVFDNYDSFTWNLVHYFEELNGEIPDVYLNDEISGKEAIDYDAVILSPGPGLPAVSGNLMDVISGCAGKIPVLGICLGHQAITEYYGGRLKQLQQVRHGIQYQCNVIDKSGIFKNLPDKFLTGHYHSWVSDKNSFPEVLQISAEDEAGEIMAFQHKTSAVTGIQFHPESILTEFGKDILRNWMLMNGLL